MANRGTKIFVLSRFLGFFEATTGVLENHHNSCFLETRKQDSHSLLLALTVK